MRTGSRKRGCSRGRALANGLWWAGGQLGSWAKTRERKNTLMMYVIRVFFSHHSGTSLNGERDGFGEDNRLVSGERRG